MKIRQDLNELGKLSSFFLKKKTNNWLSPANYIQNQHRKLRHLETLGTNSNKGLDTESITQVRCKVYTQSRNMHYLKFQKNFNGKWVIRRKFINDFLTFCFCLRRSHFLCRQSIETSKFYFVFEKCEKNLNFPFCTISHRCVM